MLYTVCMVQRKMSNITPSVCGISSTALVHRTCSMQILTCIERRVRLVFVHMHFDISNEIQRHNATKHYGVFCFVFLCFVLFKSCFIRSDVFNPTKSIYSMKTFSQFWDRFFCLLGRLMLCRILAMGSNIY